MTDTEYNSTISGSNEVVASALAYKNANLFVTTTRGYRSFLTYIDLSTSF